MKGEEDCRCLRFPHGCRQRSKVSRSHVAESVPTFVRTAWCSWMPIHFKRTKFDSQFISMRPTRLEEIKALPQADLIRLIQAKDEDRRSMLHAAAANGHTDLLEYLLTKGAADSIDDADDEGWTPLMSATSAGQEAAVQLLLKAGADANRSNSGGRTALHYAGSKGRVLILRLLLNKRADLTAADSTGSNPMHRACSAGHVEAVKLLVEEGKAPLETRDKTGSTPLCVAAASGSKEVALYLITKGADVEAENKEEETPLSEAARHPGLRDAMVAVAKGEMSIGEEE